MRQIGSRLLWVGNAGDLLDPRLVLNTGIAAVVELADSEPLAVLPRELIRLRFPLCDGTGNPAWLLQFAASSVAELLRAEIPTVVCCGYGLSRSVCIAAAAIAIAECRTLEETLREVAEAGPADVSPGLLVELKAAMMAT